MKKKTEPGYPTKNQRPAYDLANELILTEPYLNYISRIPKELRFLFYIDYALFDKKNETWIQYDQREPGCVGDLFGTHAKILYSYISISPRKKLDLQHIIELQTTLSKSLLVPFPFSFDMWS